jgi:hypothetical protein
MKKEKNHEILRQFFLKNFKTTANIDDRLLAKDIVNKEFDNKFLFSLCKSSEVFKSIDIGDHDRFYNINIHFNQGA